MKLRILGNTIRLRLSQTEVEQMRHRGRVEHSIEFGPVPEQQLRYTLVADSSCARMQATFEGRSITVSIPAAEVDHWACSDQVGLQAQQPIDDQRSLEILVEKDFQCLEPRRGEEDYDGFPNPKATC